MEISSPRSSNDSGAGSGGSGFGTYIGQCMAKNNGSSPDRGEQAEYLANSQVKRGCGEPPKFGGHFAEIGREGRGGGEDGDGRMTRDGHE